MVAPIISSSVFAICIDCCSNIIAQRLKAWKIQTPFTFDPVLFAHFALFAAITAPWNFLWQSWLEKTFPGWIHVQCKQNELEMGRLVPKERVSEDAWAMPGEQVRVRDWWNIFKKWFMDCITFGTLFNTVAFLVIMGILKGKSGIEIRLDLEKETISIIVDSWKVWPIANIISTTFVPVERRIVFLSLCGLTWKVYLSLIAARL